MSLLLAVAGVVLVLCSHLAIAQAVSAAFACDDQKLWCDTNGKVVPPSPAKLTEQCTRYPSTCKNGKPVRLADSGCVDPEGWVNYCTDDGRLRPPTAAEQYYMEHCGETIDGEYYQCE
jgi:hypothetical protein